MVNFPYPKHDFRLAPWRRRLFLGLVLATLVLGALFLVVTFGRNCDCPYQGPVEFTVACLIFLSLTVAAALPLRWRVRIDNRGVSLRRLFRWHTITWRELAGGLVHKLHPYSLFLPSRPGWRNTLHLHKLSPTDLQEVMRLIDTVYVLPEPQIEHWVLVIERLGRQRIILSEKGIQHICRGETTTYSWDSVRRVLVTRMGPLRADFMRLILVLPDRTLELRESKHDSHNPNWQGPCAEEICVYILAHVPRRKVVEHLYNESCCERVVVEHDLATEGIYIATSVFMGGLLAMMFALISFVYFNQNGWWAGVYCSVGSTLGLGVMYLIMAVYHRRRLVKLRKRLATATDCHTPSPLPADLLPPRNKQAGEGVTLADSSSLETSVFNRLGMSSKAN